MATLTGLQFLLTAAAAALLLAVRLWFVLRSIRQHRRQAAQKQDKTEQKSSSFLPPIRTLVVLGSGGHTAEAVSFMQLIDRSRYRPLVYVKALTDTTSEPKVRQHEISKNNGENCQFISIYRSREVRQSWVTSAFSSLYALLHSFAVVVRVRPQLIICNGPGTCVPICVAAFALRVLFLSRCRIVFVESFCRVRSLSLSGKLLYPFADRFVVQWPQLTQSRPLAEFLPNLC